jgi:hypothetical protein
VNVGGRSSPFLDRGGGSLWPIVDGCGSCEKRVVVTCDNVKCVRLVRV